MKTDSLRVCAVVVTWNRRDLLAQCLRALQKQTRPLDTILVVDNKSTDDTLKMLSSEFAGVEILALPENVGGAGGFHAGMKHAFEAGSDWIWIMDDDGTPAPNCLEELMRPIDGPLAPQVLLPVQRDNAGRLYGMSLNKKEMAAEIIESGAPRAGKFLFTFVGPMFHREVIRKLGLPIKEFFIWFDDFEYSVRVHRARMPIVGVPAARFFHDPGGGSKEFSFLGRKSVRPQPPPWKIYYGARNGLYMITRCHPMRRDLGAFLRNEMRLLIGDAVYDPEGWQCVRMRLRGLRDGALGRLGKRT